MEAIEIVSTELTLKECFDQLKVLADQSQPFIDEVPEPLQRDFNEFIIGQTISTVDGRSVTYDMKKYYDKVMYGAGVSYRIKFKTEAA